MSHPFDLDAALRLVDGVQSARVAGKVTELTGLVLRATAPGARAGELVIIDRSRGEPLRAEVVGFRGDEVVLLPLGDVAGVGPDSVVRPTGRPFAIRCGPSLCGRVLDGLGEPIDGRGPLGAPEMLEPWPVERAAPDPLSRRRVTAPLALGVRALDGCLTVGEGQRIGLFAGPGLGKSTLLGQIARQSEAEVNVIALVGERGREVRDFVETELGDGLSRSVVVAATSDAPPLLRLKSALVATAIAEHFRERGKRVLLLLDSLTRVARAQREVGLAAGEPPARQGFPPSVFAMLPRLLERTGQSERGSITAVYAVLTQQGSDDVDDPIAEEVRAILDGHVWLSRDLAAQGHWPAIDVVRSLSRVMDEIVDEPQRAAAARLREVISTYERQRDLVLLGAYRRGSDEDTDYALDRIDDAYGFLRQARDERAPFAETRERLIALFGD